MSIIVGPKTVGLPCALYLLLTCAMCNAPASTDSAANQVEPSVYHQRQDFVGVWLWSYVPESWEHYVLRYDLTDSTCGYYIQTPGILPVCSLYKKKVIAFGGYKGHWYVSNDTLNLGQDGNSLAPVVYKYRFLSPDTLLLFHAYSKSWRQFIRMQ